MVVTTVMVVWDTMVWDTMVMDTPMLDIMPAITELSKLVFPTPTDGLMVPTMDSDPSMAVRSVKQKLTPLSCMVVTTVMVVWDTMVTDTPTMLATMPAMVLLSKLVFPMPTDGLMVPTMDLVPSMENISLSNK